MSSRAAWTTEEDRRRGEEEAETEVAAVELICLYTWQLLDSSLLFHCLGQRLVRPSNLATLNALGTPQARNTSITGDMVSPAPASDSAVSGMSLVTYRSVDNLKSNTSWKIQSLSSNL